MAISRRRRRYLAAGAACNKQVVASTTVEQRNAATTKRKQSKPRNFKIQMTLGSKKTHKLLHASNTAVAIKYALNWAATKGFCTGMKIVSHPVGDTALHSKVILVSVHTDDYENKTLLTIIPLRPRFIGDKPRKQKTTI